MIINNFTRKYNFYIYYRKHKNTIFKNMLILNILIITFVITYIIGSSGILFDLSKFIYNLTHKKEWSYQMIR